MPIQTSVPTSLRQPGSFHEFLDTQAGAGLVPLPQRIALIGVKSPAGTAAVASPVQLYDANDSDTKLGAGSEVALMARTAFAQAALQGASPEIWAAPLAGPTGAQATQTITITVTSTPGGNLVLSVGDTTITVGVSPGDTGPTIATAIQAALAAAAASLPVTSTVATNAVTCKHVTAGVNGNDVVYALLSAPAGVTVTLAQTVAGSGAADITPALDALLDKDYDGLVIANHTQADIVAGRSHAVAAWAPSQKRYRWCYFAETSALGAGLALAMAANDKTVLVATCEGTPSQPGQVAAAVATYALGTSQPNANYDGGVLVVAPPPATHAYSSPEIEAALEVGATPLTTTPDGTAVQIERLVTTKTIDNGAPFEALLDLAYSRTDAYVARQVEIAYRAGFRQEILDGSGDVLARIRDMVIDVHRACESAQPPVLRDVDSFLAQIVAQEAATPPGRVLVVDPFRVAGPLHQAVFVHHHYL